MTEGRSARPGRRLAPLLLVGAFALLLLPYGSGALVASASVAPYSSYDTGVLHVTLPTPTPLVNLSQDANARIGASLQLVKIVELSGATGNSTAPTVVAAAFESRAHVFNATATPDGRSDQLAGLVANLTVYRTSGLLFPLASSDIPRVPLIPIAPTTLSVTVRTTGARDVVGLSATVQNWPWVSTTDLLAIGWEFGVSNDVGFAGCAGSHPASVPSSPCGQDAFAYGNSTWGWNGFEGIQGLTLAGPEAQLLWGDSVALPDGQSAPVVAGAQRTSSDHVEVVYGASASGASSLTFGLSYALAPPALPVTLLHGSLAAYLAGASVASAMVGIGVYAARRRDRRLLDAL